MVLMVSIAVSKTEGPGSNPGTPAKLSNAKLSSSSRGEFRREFCHLG